VTAEQATCPDRGMPHSEDEEEQRAAAALTLLAKALMNGTLSIMRHHDMQNSGAKRWVVCMDNPLNADQYMLMAVLLAPEDQGRYQPDYECSHGAVH
jgi:hypothetical protein